MKDIGRPMRTVLPAIVLAVGAIAGPAGELVWGRAAPGPPPHYAVRLQLDPAAGTLEAHVTIDHLPSGASMDFLLAEGLEIASSAPAVERVALDDAAEFGLAGAGTPIDRTRSARYRTAAIPPSGRLELAYRGRMAVALAAQKEEYARGFRETPGLIAREGVYLAGASLWYPQTNAALLTFELEVPVPEGWHVISQGEGSSRDDRGLAHWKTRAPMEEIYVVGGPLRVWRDRAGAVETFVYLHDDEPALAGRYLEATARYLSMYERLIGSYPYSKFALVENFWETGYGMPSFTLLGPSIIRFPFILTSSYPHEILHNWWGNSVYVDHAQGNWSEGLTAYLADHLLKEQRGQGADHRRAALQKYASYVGGARDFPLSAFRARDSAATEAVGYGKTMMGFHMLRQRLGDDRFTLLLSRFYREHTGRRATFGDLQRVAEDVAGESLAAFFDSLVARTGAPTLTAEVTTRLDGQRHVVRGVVRQTQPGPPFAFDVPVVLQTEGDPLRTVARFDGANAAFEFHSDRPPVALRVDPAFDVFRALDPLEIPSSIGQIFGEARIVAVLPSAAPQAEQRAWRTLVESWASEAHAIDVVSDQELAALADARAAWILGRENRLAPSLFLETGSIELSSDALVLEGRRVAYANHSVVLTRRHPSQPGKAVGWILNGVPAAFDGLARKLPHYGRYSYLVFEGEEPANTVSGEWAAEDSPLAIDLRSPATRRAPLPAVDLPPARPLIDLPAPFSAEALAGDVAWLAAPEREGRGLGTAGLTQAAEYIAARFASLGLVPGGQDGSFFQTVTVEEPGTGRRMTSVNVIGILRGTAAAWTDQSVLVTAHYDHLGRGTHETSAADAGAGAIHPGADDNASGVAVLLELARVLTAAARPPRSVVFVALTAEESGLQGARQFIDRGAPLPVDHILAVINLDTVGRLGTGTVSILGAGTATEWPHIFRGASYVTGVDSTSVPGNYEASDQRVFIERHIPAVQVFTGPHPDYHRPGDTFEKIDVPGLVKVASLVKEAVAYLAERPSALTVTIASGTDAGRNAPAGVPSESARRVAFGAVPDFTFEGLGVRLADVTAGSPASRAGLRAGDVILRIEASAVTSLQSFATILRALRPEQHVEVVYQRDGIESTAHVTVVAR